MTDSASPTTATVPPDDFPVEWAEPRDAELSWEWDDMHMPYALTPLAADYVRTLASGFAYAYQRLEIPIDIVGRVWNGYAYFALDTRVPEEEQPAMWDRRTERARARIPLTEAYWRDEAVPELRGHYAWVDGLAVEAMPGDELAERWDEAWTRIGRCWSIHFYAIRGPYQVLDDLADRYEADRRGRATRAGARADFWRRPRAARCRAPARVPGGPRRCDAGPEGAHRPTAPDRRRADGPSRRRRVRDGARRLPRRARPPRPAVRRPRGAVLGGGAGSAAGRAREADRAPAGGRGRGASRSGSRRTPTSSPTTFVRASPPTPTPSPRSRRCSPTPARSGR